jgi:NADH-quinone oxidoreductase subunit C
VPPQGAGPTPDSTPAAKEEIATDLSEIARARLSGSDKTLTGGSIAEDAADAAPGIAGTPPDDDTAAAVEDAPTAVLGKDHPGPAARGEQGPDAPTPTPPAGPAGAPPPMTATGGGSRTAPAETQPAGTGAATRPPTPTSAQTPATPAQGAPSGPPAGDASTTPAAPSSTPPAPSTAPAAASGATAGPSPDAPPARPGNGAARAADPDTTATAPTAPDAAATAAGTAAATAEAEKKPGAPATPARPAAGARPAGAAGAAKPGAKPAAPAKPPEPDPEEVTSLRDLVPDLTWERRHGYLEVRVPKDQLVPVARKVKGLGYDYLSAVTAVDWRDRVEMLYHCYGWDYVNTPGCVVIRADLPPEPNPLCPSLTTVWAGAELQEREIYDLFGVKFVGHPDLRRILLDDNFPGHPLRKDWTFDYEYVLVKHLKYGAEGQDAPPGGEEGFRRV